MGELLDIRELCQHMKVSVPYVRMLTRTKQLPHIKIGRRVLYRQQDIEAWLQQREVHAGNGAGQRDAHGR